MFRLCPCVGDAGAGVQKLARRGARHARVPRALRAAAPVRCSVFLAAARARGGFCAGALTGVLCRAQPAGGAPARGRRLPAPVVAAAHADWRGQHRAVRALLSPERGGTGVSAGERREAERVSRPAGVAAQALLPHAERCALPQHPPAGERTLTRSCDRCATALQATLGAWTQCTCPPRSTTSRSGAACCTLAACPTACRSDGGGGGPIQTPSCAPCSSNYNDAFLLALALPPGVSKLDALTLKGHAVVRARCLTHGHPARVKALAHCAAAAAQHVSRTQAVDWVDLCQRVRALTLVGEMLVLGVGPVNAASGGLRSLEEMQVGKTLGVVGGCSTGKWAARPQMLVPLACPAGAALLAFWRGHRQGHRVSRGEVHVIERVARARR